MSSANEHLQPPPKPRMSPLDFRNTDLVSRLLAATPPYLYNMSLLPNTYFFSEMLRSFVQAKAEHSGRGTSSSVVHQGRRSRKRTWSTTRTECFQKQQLQQQQQQQQMSTTPKSPEKSEIPVDWMLRSNNKIEENNPLELTINKIESSSETESKIPIPNFQNKLETFPKPEVSINEQIFPTLHHPAIGNQENPSNLVLPPPPPIWYPPLYPAPPYGIDPLHFFIDLRVSGHIYDRKNQKDSPPTTSFPSTTSRDKPPQTHNTEIEVKSEESNQLKDIFKQPRHTSAFSVPVPSATKNSPINLSPNENRSTKFDVKSMGFDKSNNKTSTNYIMSNIKSIYQNIDDTKDEHKNGHKSSPIEYSETALPEETEEEREKRVKDLRALIGLELVVDYMNHAKPGQLQHPQQGSQSVESVNSTDLESLGSPTLEVVDLHDET